MSFVATTAARLTRQAAGRTHVTALLWALPVGSATSLTFCEDKDDGVFGKLTKMVSGGDQGDKGSDFNAMLDRVATQIGAQVCRTTTVLQQMETVLVT